MREVRGDEADVANAPTHHSECHTVQGALQPRLSGGASGTVKIVCNGGYDNDRIVITASRLDPDSEYRVWFEQAETKRRVAPAENTVKTDAAGSLRLVVTGSVCPLPDFTSLAISQKGVTVLTAVLK